MGSYSVCMIFSGLLADKYNRKRLMFGACLLWSTCTLLSGIINSYWVMFVCRFLLGIFESVFAPCAFSIIADYFPPSQRASANSVLNMGIYLGVGISSLSIMFIKEYGWRWTYDIIGMIGIGSGFLLLFFVKEPKRGTYEPLEPIENTIGTKWT